MRKKAKGEVTSLTRAPHRRLSAKSANQVRETAIRQLAIIAMIVESRDASPLPGDETITLWLTEWLRPSLRTINRFHKRLEKEIGK